MKKMPSFLKSVKVPKVATVKAPKTNAAKVNTKGMKRIKSMQRGM